MKQPEAAAQYGPVALVESPGIAKSGTEVVLVRANQRVVQCMPFSYVEITPPDERQPLLLSSGGAPCGHRAMISPVVTGEDGVHYR